MGGRGVSWSSTTYKLKSQREKSLDIFDSEGHIIKEKVIKDGDYSKLAEILNVDEDRAKELYKAVFSYTDLDYMDIAAYQTGKLSDVTMGVDKAKRRSEAIEEYIRRAPDWNGGNTYRGIPMSKKRSRKNQDWCYN